MDLTLSDDQAALVALAARILGDRSAPEALAAAEAGGDRFDPELWRLLAEADLLGLCLPMTDGGGGYGILEAALLCQEVGRAAAAVPLWATLCLGAMPLAHHDPGPLRRELLPRVADGSLVLSAAVVEDGSAVAPVVPVTTASATGRGWELRGSKHIVPAVHLAEAGVDVRVLVPAATGDGASTVFVVDPTAPGIELDRQVGTDLEPLATVTFDGATVDADAVVGAVGGGAEVTATIVAIGTAGICARQAGTCEAALRTAAAYTSEREQFGAKIATFQAVAHRLADAYIDTEAVRLTAVYAAWLLDEGRPADDALAVAKVWATEGAQRVVHGAQHVHGGIGFDTDYPLHRWFRAAKAAEHTLGTAHPHLVSLGASIVGSACEAAPTGARSPWRRSRTRPLQESTGLLWRRSRCRRSERNRGRGHFASGNDVHRASSAGRALAPSAHLTSDAPSDVVRPQTPSASARPGCGATPQNGSDELLEWTRWCRLP